VLPGKLTRRVRVFAGERIRERDAGESLAQVLRVDGFHVRKLSLEQNEQNA